MAVKSLFYKEDDGKIRGPFSEKEIQEGYRKSFFDKQTVFYYMASGDCPTEENEGISLEQLIELNGHGSPFEFTNIEANQVLKLNEVKQTMAPLQEQISKFSNLYERVDNICKKMEKLSKLAGLPDSENTKIDGKIESNTATDKTEATIERASTGVPPWKSEMAKENEREDRTATFMNENEHRLKSFANTAQFIVDFYDLLQNRNFGQPPDFYICAERNLRVCERYVLESESNMDEFFKGLCAAMMKKQHFVCDSCRYIMINYKHALIHLVDPEHFNKLESYKFGPLNRITNLFSALIIEQTKKFQPYVEWQISDSRKNEDDVKFRENPRVRLYWQEFEKEIKELFEEDVFEINRARGEKIKWCVVFEQGFEKLKKDDRGGRIMSFIHHRISSGPLPITCRECHVACESVDAFYKHIKSYSHVKATSVYDVTTLVVNALEKKSS